MEYSRPPVLLGISDRAASGLWRFGGNTGQKRGKWFQNATPNKVNACNNTTLYIILLPSELPYFCTTQVKNALRVMLVNAPPYCEAKGQGAGLSSCHNSEEQGLGVQKNMGPVCITTKWLLASSRGYYEPLNTWTFTYTQVPW